MLDTSAFNIDTIGETREIPHSAKDFRKGWKGAWSAIWCENMDTKIIVS